MDKEGVKLAVGAAVIYAVLLGSFWISEFIKRGA